MKRFNAVRGRSVPKTPTGKSSKTSIVYKNRNLHPQTNPPSAINSLLNSAAISPKSTNPTLTQNYNNIFSKTQTFRSNSPEKNCSINCTEMKEIRDKILKANEIKAKENQIKDKEVDDLNEAIHKIMTENIELQEVIEDNLQQRHFYEKEQKKIAEYCNDLSYKFRNFEQTIRDYENRVHEMKLENENLQCDYDNKIAEIDAENEKLQKRISDRKELILAKTDEMKEKKAKIQNLSGEITRQNNTFKERNELNKNKFEELSEKYSDMLKKVYELQMGNIEKNPRERRIEKIRPTAEEKKKMQIKEIEKKIETWEQDNEELVEEINDLNNKYKAMSKTTEKLGNNLPTFFKTTVNSTTGGNVTGMSEIKPTTTKNFYN